MKVKMEELTQIRQLRNGNVYGLIGISKLFGCSQATAQRIKSSGVINEAISQNGKIIVVDADLALDLLKVSNKKWGRKYSK